VLLALLALVALAAAGFAMGRASRGPDVPAWPRTVAGSVLTVPFYRLGLPPVLAPRITTTGR
jgi:hypothetical protein